MGVYNIDGSLYAIANYCSHEGAPLCAGYVVGTTEFAPDEPGQVRYVREGQIARCPWHNWEFDITTGRISPTRSKRVRTYEVDVSDGQVFFDRMSERDRHERAAAFPVQRGDPALLLAAAQAAGDPRCRAAVVSGARRRLPPGPVRRRLSGLRPRDRRPAPVRRGRCRLRDPQPADARQHRRLPAEQPDLRGGQRLAARPLAGARHHRTASSAPSGSTPRTSRVRSPRSSGWPAIRRWCRSVCRCSRGSRTASRCSNRSGKRPPRTGCRWRFTSTAATASTTRRPSRATRSPIPAMRRSCR